MTKVNVRGKAAAMRVRHSQTNPVLTSEGFHRECLATIQDAEGPECHWASLKSILEKLEAQVSDRPLLNGVTSGGCHPECLTSIQDVEGPQRPRASSGSIMGQGEAWAGRGRTPKMTRPQDSTKVVFNMIVGGGRSIGRKAKNLRSGETQSVGRSTEFSIISP